MFPISGYRSNIISSNIIDTINNSDINSDIKNGRRSSYRYHSKPLEPITYISMTGWLAMNYSLIILLPSLIGLIVYEVIKMI